MKIGGLFVWCHSWIFIGEPVEGTAGCTCWRFCADQKGKTGFCFGLDVSIAAWLIIEKCLRLLFVSDRISIICTRDHEEALAMLLNARYILCRNYVAQITLFCAKQRIANVRRTPRSRCLTCC